VIQERWQKIKEKLDAALDLEPAGRRAFLDQVASADPELRCGVALSKLLNLCKSRPKLAT